MTTTMGCRDIISIQQGLVTLIRLYFQAIRNSIVTDMQMEKTNSSREGHKKHVDKVNPQKHKGVARLKKQKT